MENAKKEITMLNTETIIERILDAMDRLQYEDCRIELKGLISDLEKQKQVLDKICIDNDDDL